MRLRKKKNLEERIEKVKDYLVSIEGADFYYKPERREQVKVDLDKAFGENVGRPLYLELGCGKGKFVCEMAKKYPNVNFVALEKVPNVIVSAIERAQSEQLVNVKFICGSAENLLLFLEPNTVDRLFLNFSCPYPKHTYANHRLTHQKFLKLYKELMKNGAKIEQKTDNMGLFEFSIEQLSKAGFELSNISLDLHNSGIENNVMTEYESNFVSMGKPIYRLEATLKK